MLRPTRSLSVFTAVLLSATTAGACGDFFCSFAPMNQVSERILFVDRGDSVTAHVQIAYTGEAADFAWILPVPSRPSLAVSHNELFNQLQFATQPMFLLEWQEGVDDCGFLFPPFVRFEEASPTSAEDGVTVVAEERVGPYDTVVITADDPAAVVHWLADNGYQLGALGPELLAPYVEGGMHFLALRLAPNRELGDLQPIAMTYAADTPMIPIQLTAVATEPDLGVTAAVDEAEGGLAFVTDYAGPSLIMEDRIYQPDRWNLDALRRIDDPGRFIDALLRQGFPRDAQMQSLLRRHVPMPQAVLDEGVLQVVFGGDIEAWTQAQKDGRLLPIAERAFYTSAPSRSGRVTWSSTRRPSSMTSTPSSSRRCVRRRRCSTPTPCSRGSIRRCRQAK